MSITDLDKAMSFNTFKKRVLADYRLAALSRICSLLGRREVLSGKAKFGIFGDGKELPQIVLSHFFKKGDWRSGYYRDQTLMMGLDLMSLENFFAGLYADTNPENEPFSAGRQMGGHFSTKNIQDNTWINQLTQYNTSTDISCTAGQMPRLVGLAYASKLFRNNKNLQKGFENFSHKGDEIAWGTIGNASTSEGHFFEAINAAGVLQIPMVISIWDDDYGISVHNKDHTTKESISKILEGFKPEGNLKGVEIIRVNGWDYTALFQTYQKAEKLARLQHIPVMVHVTELTQPLGHSTSGSHERYKDEKRLAWEKKYDCNEQFRNWILNFQRQTEDGQTLKIADEKTLLEIEQISKKEAVQAKKKAVENYRKPIDNLQKTTVQILEKTAQKSSHKHFINHLKDRLKKTEKPYKKDIYSTVRNALAYLKNDPLKNKIPLQKWAEKLNETTTKIYNSKLYATEPEIQQTPLKYKENSPLVDGRIIIRDNFEALLEKYDSLFIFGEDAGKIGDVNQGLEGLQDKFGSDRVTDTGIRELTIIGQGIGMALRGLRPIAEIQYLDYVLYALQTLSDDLACLHYRSNGNQIAPLIVRTRGHRLEGIWHAGSPMSVLLGALRGMYLLVPRDMTQAAGFYNTLLQSNNPAILIECLNGYRSKEKRPENLGVYTTPIGVVEILRKGTDITIVSYGAALKIVMESLILLQQVGIAAEVIDAQSLLPFDTAHDSVKSVQKTGRLLVVDEDVPGGGSTYLLQQIIEVQKGYQFLDSAPQTLTAQAHRTAYGTDGDYFSKPSKEDVFEKVYQIFHEDDPLNFPSLM